MKKITLLFAMLAFSFGFSQTFTDAGGPYPIQNGQTGTTATCGTAFELNLPLAVSGIGTLGDVNVIESVTVNITHTWNADVRLTLIAPDGLSELELINANVGGSGDGFTNCIFADGGAVLPTANTTPVTGTFAPQGVGGFIGLNATGAVADGNWTLNVCDNANGDVGNVVNWSITFGPAPSCPDPNLLTATNFTTTSADLGWSENGSSTNWDIEWGLDGFTPTGTPNVNDTGDNPYTLGGLAEGTDYEFYVRSDCDADDTNVSAWVGPFAFTTAFSEPDCATTPFPANGAIDVPVGDIEFTWTAPASGPTPTSYNIYAYDDAAGTNPALIANVTTTSADLTILAYGADIFWAAVPVNGTTEATGCAVWSFTTEAFPGFCLAAEWGQFPAATFTPTTCDGVTANEITTNAWASEYALVTVVSGQTYRFTSSAPDLITISYDGTTAEAFGVSEVTWTATADGNVRFYTHLNDNNCSQQQVARTKAVLCGPTLGVDSFDISALKVYPNPVKDVLNLSYTTEISSVSVYNMLGQMVLSKTVNANQEVLNMSELNTGAYFVKVTINDRTETIRVIKQ